MAKLRRPIGERNLCRDHVTGSSEDLLAGRRQPSLRGGDNSTCAVSFPGRSTSAGGRGWPSVPTGALGILGGQKAAAPLMVAAG